MIITEHKFNSGRKTSAQTKETSHTSKITFGVNAIWLKAYFDAANPTVKFQIGWNPHNSSEVRKNILGLSKVQIIELWGAALVDIHSEEGGDDRIPKALPSVATMTKWLNSLVGWANKYSTGTYKLKNGMLYHNNMRSHTVKLAEAVTLRPELRRGEFASMLVDFSHTSNGSRDRKRMSFSTYDALASRWAEVTKSYNDFITRHGLISQVLNIPSRLEWQTMIQKQMLIKS
jgi:hypothetical protein